MPGLRGSRRAAIFVFFILFAAAAAFAQQAARTVLVGLFPAAPLVFERDSKPQGLFIDVIEHIAKDRRWSVEYVRGTWNELLKNLVDGDIDLLPAVGYTEARTQVYDFTGRPLFIDSGVVFTGRGSSIHTIFDLDGKKVTAVKGSIFTDAFAELMASFGIECEIVYSADNIEVMREVAAGRAFAGVCIYSLGNELAKEYPVSITPISFSPIALEFAVPKGRNADLISGIDEAMGAMMDDPASAYSKSYARWLDYGAKARIPVAIWIVIAAIAAAGGILGAASLALKREVANKTASLRDEVAKHKRAEEELSASLGSNKILLRELYHRTKNTLQLIRSYIAIEAMEFQKSDNLDRLVKKTTERIDSISLVHEMLYRRKDLSQISIKEYLDGLVDLIVPGVSTGRDIRIAKEIEDSPVLIDTAIPLGLIINELLTNSVIHAFVDGRKGVISISLRSVGSGRVEVVYGDNGVGVPDGFDIRGQTTLGLKLVVMIVETQLNGTIEADASDGFKLRISFPNALYEARV